MPSPFPGMDPYLEDPALWMDFRERFITYCSDFINVELPDHYETRIEERISLVEMSEEELRNFRADIAVMTAQKGNAGRPPERPAPNAGGAVIAEPVTIPLVMYDEIRMSNVNVYDRRSHRLVTVIELLSPSNKISTGFEEYLVKHTSILRTRTHLVEIDLLIGGNRLPSEGPLPVGDYYTFVSRGDRRMTCDIFPCSIRNPLPVIPIPLLSPDPDLPLNLQELFAYVYDRGRYRKSLRYSDPPAAMLPPDDSKWAADLVKG